MYQQTTVTTAPDGYPISMALAALQLNKEVGDCDDDLVALTLAACVAWVEKQYGLRLLTQTIIEYHDAAPCGGPDNLYQQLTLLNYPIQQVTKIEYRDPDTEDWEEYTPLTDFATSPMLHGMTAVYPKSGVSWPDMAVTPASLRFTCTAGYGSTGEAVPADIRQAILLMLADFYENRENPAMSRNMTAAQNLLRPYYRPKIAA